MKKANFGKLAGKSLVATGSGAVATLAVVGLQKIPKLSDKPLVITGIIEAVGLFTQYLGKGNEYIEQAGLSWQAIAGYRAGWKVAEMVQAGVNEPGVVNGTLNAAGQKKVASLQRMASLARSNERKAATTQSAPRVPSTGNMSNTSAASASTGQHSLMKPRPQTGTRSRRSKMFYCYN